MTNAELFVSCTDLHFTSRVPACRSDDYVRTALHKFERVLEFARQTKFKAVICAGDFFDSASRNVSFELIQLLVELLHLYSDVDVYTAVGNHDMRFHSTDFSNTPISLLQASAKNFHIVYGQNLIHAKDEEKLTMLIIASHWGDGLDVKLNAEAERILYDAPTFTTVVAHVAVFDGKKPNWLGEEEGYEAKEFVERVKYHVPNVNFIITGHVHDRFMYYDHSEMRTPILVNSGCMLRNTVQLVDYTPKFARYNATFDDDGTVNNFGVTFHNYSAWDDTDVFNQAYVEEQQTIRSSLHFDLDGFLEEVNAAANLSLDYPTALRAVINKKHPKLMEKLGILLESN